MSMYDELQDLRCDSVDIRHLIAETAIRIDRLDRTITIIFDRLDKIEALLCKMSARR